ncbi:MAG: hypothetical protein C4294_10200, partial [Nitrospiraceae bacterium]
MKQKILFVDDEPNVLNGLRRTPPSLEQEWGIAFATSGQEALAILSQDSYDVIITDMRMPDMDGGRLLSEVRVRHPHVVRVLLSDQSDLEAVLRSVSSAHQCLSKSCTPDLLRATVARACAVRDLLANDALRKLVSGMQTLPSLPALYREVMEELQSPDASIEKVGRIIAKDMGMVTKILQLVNSPFYGLRTHISSATQAVALLGLDTIKSLVLSMKVFSQFEGAHQSFFSLEVLWNHGMMVGRCAQIIAKEQGVDQRIMEDAFTAGLLHDVGLLVLATNLPTQYTDTLALIQDRGIPEWEAEREVLGATHGDIGGVERHDCRGRRLPPRTVSVGREYVQPADRRACGQCRRGGRGVCGDGWASGDDGCKLSFGMRSVGQIAHLASSVPGAFSEPKRG